MLRSLLWLIHDLTLQACEDEDRVFSDFIGCHAEAMRLLGRYGMLEITNDGFGRCVEGKSLGYWQLREAISKIEYKPEDNKWSWK